MTTTRPAPPAPGAPRSVPSGLGDWTGSGPPARLRRVGAVLALGCVLTALVALLSGVSRTDAVDDVVGADAALSRDAGVIYQGLADADATATNGYVSGGREPADVRRRYDDALAGAGRALARAGAQLGPGDPGSGAVAEIVTGLPGYAGLVETARTYNRQGLPLGQAYLSTASRQMRERLLPAAAQLRAERDAEQNADLAAGAGVPVAVLLLGAATLTAGVLVSRREYERTRRVLSPGLALAGGLTVVGLLWWVAVTAAGGAALYTTREAGDAASALDTAHTSVLQARSNEALVLVARSGGGASDQSFALRLSSVRDALEVARAGGRPVDEIRAALDAWSRAHADLRALDDGGRYAEAVASAVGTSPGSSGATFAGLDGALSRASDAARAQFDDAAATADTLDSGLTVVPVALFLVAAGAVVVGIGRRVEEYR